MTRQIVNISPLENMADVKEVFETRLHSDPSMATGIHSINTKDKLCKTLERTLIKPSEKSSFNMRMSGIIKALAGLIAVVQDARLAIDEHSDQWETMLWGSLGFVIEQFNTKEMVQGEKSKPVSCLLYLGYIEDITTTVPLPTPTIRWDSKRCPYVKSSLLRLILEIACGLLNVAIFCLENPPSHMRTKNGDKYSEFEAEHRRTSSRVKCLGENLCRQMEQHGIQPNGLSKPLPQSVEKVPVHIDKHFLGRDRCLEDMNAELKQAQEHPAVLSLYGLPGIGKTQLAARYCSKYKKEYENTFWSQADTDFKIQEAFSMYAMRLGLPDRTVSGDSAKNARIFLSWLQSCDTPWILIFDNVDDVTILKDYWPNGGEGHVIITCRSPYSASFRASASIHVQPLALEDSMDMFYKIVGQEKRGQHTADLEELFQEWGGIPLALNQMGNYADRKQLSLERFVRLYKDNAPKIHQEKNDADEYPCTIVTAFSIQDLPVRAKALLHTICFLDPDNVPSELLLSGLDKGIPLNSIDSAFEYYDAVEVLCKRGLLEQLGEKLDVHRLVQLVGYNSMTDDERRQAFETVLSVLLRRFPREDHGQPMWRVRERCASYLPHVLFLCKRHTNDMHDQKSVGLAELLSACTWYMFEQGLFSEAEAHLDIGHAVLSESSDSLTAATLCFNLAGIRCECNRITEARELCERSLNIRERILAADDPLLGNTYYSMGIVYMEDNQLDRALEYNKKAVALHENCSNHDGSPTAFSYGNLGLCYLKMGELDLALKCMEKSELLWRKSCGVNSDRYATIMYYLGNLYLAQQRVDLARISHTKAFEILKMVTPHHIKTGLSYHKLACFFYDDGNFDKSIEFLELAIGIFYKQFDPVPRVARSLYKLSEVYQAAGDTDKAEAKRQEAEKLRRSITTIPFDPGPPVEAFDRLVPSFLA